MKTKQLKETLLTGRGKVKSALIEFLLKAEEKRAANGNYFDRNGNS
jgi:hypothetical protein